MATTIKIGHASGPEGTGVNGVAGDQYGNEVLIVDKYAISRLSPNVMLRPNKKTLAEKSAKACEDACKNDKIGYSQFGTDNRNTLYTQAKKVDFDMSKITTPCNTDCSAFMTACAIAGGASFKYGSNGAVCSTMRSRFTKYDDYKAFTSKKYLTSTDYLKRGDILVHEGRHTVMVLENGCKIIESDGVRISVSAKEISTTQIKVKIKLYKTEGGKEKKFSDAKELKMYTWHYTIDPLGDSNTKAKTKNLKNIDSASETFTISNLTPNTSYVICIQAKNSKGDVEFTSPNFIFTTLQTFPSGINDLTVSFDNGKLLSKKCTVSFLPPDSWGNSSYTKCIRTSLIINGQEAAYSDSLFKAASEKQKKSFELKYFGSDITLNYNDTVQIGVQAGLKHDSKFICDEAKFVCSNPKRMSPQLTQIDKLFIKIKSDFMRVILRSAIGED